VSPKVVIDERSKRASHESSPEPDRLSPDKEINIAVAVPGKRASAKKHDDADDQQSQHREKENIRAFTMHGQMDVPFAKFPSVCSK